MSVLIVHIPAAIIEKPFPTGQREHLTKNAQSFYTLLKGLAQKW
jgi:hypothetical protein